MLLFEEMVVRLTSGISFFLFFFTIVAYINFIETLEKDR